MSGLSGWRSFWLVSYLRVSVCVLRSTGWDRSNVLERNVDTPHGDYSILALTDVLRLSGTEPRYRIRVMGRALTGSYRGFIGSLPTSQSLVVHSADEAASVDLAIEDDINTYVSESRASGHFRLPWLPSTGYSLLSIGKPQRDDTVFRTIINTLSAPYLDDNAYEYVTYLMRE